MLYNGDLREMPFCTTVVPGVPKGLCTLSDFFKHMDSLTPSNYPEECKCSEIINPDWDD